MNKCIPILAVVLLAALSCQREPNSKDKHGEQLVFKTEDTILRDGDLVGVSMDAPLSYVNVKMTYSSGSLTPANKLHWPAAMPDSAVNFFAYYPYSAEYNDGGTVVFSAAPDQTSDEAFRTSALMTAGTMASVNSPSIEFIFDQQMSKVVFYVRNDSGSEIKDVFFSAYPSIQFNMETASPRVCGEKVDIHAHLSATSAEGVAAYEAIIAPQKTALTLTVKTAASEYTAILSTTTAFESGMQYPNERLVVLEAGKASKPIKFGVKEGAWATTPDFMYEEPITGADLTELTDPGLYSVNAGIATPLYTYAEGSDQYSLISGGTSRGWRLMNPALGDMFSVSASSSSFKEGNSYTVSVKSFGLEGFEQDYSSKAKAVKVANGLVWLQDSNKNYGYIMMSE